MERGQGFGNLSESLHLKQQRESSLRNRFGQGATAAVLASSLFSSPANVYTAFDQGILPRAEYVPYLEPEKTEVVAYDHSFDFEAYKALRMLPIEQKWQEKERLDAYTDKQLQTILAERLNVLTNTFYYDMIDGQLWGQDMNEPAINSFKRGRDYRRIHGNPIDFKREDAEIDGFQKIEELLRNGKSVLSISPQGGEGSIYQHNFYDVFMWKDGKIEANRFSSGLNIDDYKQILDIKGDFSDADFLASPIDITDIFNTPDDVHKFLHKEHKFTDADFFNKVIIASTRQQRLGALKALYEGDEYNFAINFNGMFNLADDLVKEYQENPSKSYFVSPVILSDQQIHQLGHRQVEQKEVGCGTSSGVKLHKNLATQLVEEAKFSVKDFDEVNKKCEDCQQTTIDKHYHCPGCKGKFASELNVAPENRTAECGGCGFKFGCKK